jgi:hypothetical protein
LLKVALNTKNYISEYFWQMMVFLADDIFVPEVRGVSRLAPYEHKNYSQTQTQLSFS